ncbi:MAG: hypothetical protein ACYDG6_11285 [Thermincolia bacterium]
MAVTNLKQLQKLGINRGPAVAPVKPRAVTPPKVPAVTPPKASVPTIPTASAPSPVKASAPPVGFVPIRSTAEGVGAQVGWDSTKGVSLNGQYMNSNDYVVVDGRAYANPGVLEGNYLNANLFGPGSGSMGMDPSYDAKAAQVGSTAVNRQETFRGIADQYKPVSAPDLKPEILPELAPKEAAINPNDFINTTAQQFYSGFEPILTGATGAVQSGSLKMMNETLDMIAGLESQLMSRAKEMLGGVDEATMWAIQGVKNTVKEQRDRLTDEMNRRGLLQSGVWLEEENRINAGQLDAESQIRLARVGELQNMLWNSLTNFANQRIDAVKTYGKDYVSAIDKEYENRMKAWDSATGQAVDMYGDQLNRIQDQNQFDAKLTEEERQFDKSWNIDELTRQNNQRVDLADMWGVDPVTGKPTLQSKLVGSQIQENNAQANKALTSGTTQATKQTAKTEKANTTAKKVETYYKNQLPKNFETPEGFYKYLTSPDRATAIINDIGSGEYRKLVDWARKYME